MKKLEFVTKLNPKGQLVLRKEMRKAIGIKPGSIVKTRLENKHVIIEPFDVKKEIEKIEEIAKMVSKKIPKGRTSVDIIREQRD